MIYKAHLSVEVEEIYSILEEYGNRKLAFSMKQCLDLYEQKDSNH